MPGAKRNLRYSTWINNWWAVLRMSGQLWTVCYPAAGWETAHKWDSDSQCWVLNRFWEVWKHKRDVACFSLVWKSVFSWSKALKAVFVLNLFVPAQSHPSAKFLSKKIHMLRFSLRTTQVSSENFQALENLFCNLPAIWVIFAKAKIGKMLQQPYYRSANSYFACMQCFICSSPRRLQSSPAACWRLEMRGIFSVYQTVDYDVLRAMLEGKDYQGIDTVFSFIARFIDIVSKFQNDLRLKESNTIYSELFKALCSIKRLVELIMYEYSPWEKRYKIFRKKCTVVSESLQVWTVQNQVPSPRITGRGLSKIWEISCSLMQPTMHTSMSIWKELTRNLTLEEQPE